MARTINPYDMTLIKRYRGYNSIIRYYDVAAKLVYECENERPLRRLLKRQIAAMTMLDAAIADEEFEALTMHTESEKGARRVYIPHVGELIEHSGRFAEYALHDAYDTAKEGRDDLPNMLKEATVLR